MALNREILFWHDALTGKNTYTVTWTVDFPPAKVIAKVSPAFYMEYGSPAMLGTEIWSYRRRLASGADQTISAGAAPAVFDYNMTSVTYGLFIFNCQAQIVLDLGYWG